MDACETESVIIINQGLTPTTQLSPQLVAEKAFAVASSAEYAPASRTTALQIAAAEDDPRAVVLARDLLDLDGDVQLRLSALAVLGKMGNASDIVRLESIASSEDVRLRAAAAAALESLRKQS